MNVIEIKGLTKYYGDFRALNQINLNVKKGEVLGFLGPNGAGKTTTIRILLGMLKKSSGIAKIFGKDVWKDSVDIHRRLAYVPGDVHLWPNLTGGEVIDLFCQLRGGLDQKTKKGLIQRFDLDPTKKCGTYSKGNRQKVALIAAFSSDVDLYILDEPTSGLDPLMTCIFQECVKELKERGKTILMSSHILADVEKLCDTVTIIRRGEIVETGTLKDLRHMTRITMEVETEVQPTELKNFEWIYNLKVVDNKMIFQVDHNRINEILQYLTKFNIKSMVSTPPTLEELFMSYYGEDIALLKNGKGGGI
ncbi:ABC-2 type transport system ATP-binding protein [Anaerobranca gottschalkii DSM 13577]|uniref:ABC-2 type transport system ATP-binding protein n=2 Tax=Anaerobranca gottschalkii TaxID=108328 RepID=A0A1H9ZNR7_9FIRM|nr:ABC-2 type transport system ATP-binding protein [Anaerobranca gottschalkii DSM 13577]